MQQNNQSLQSALQEISQSDVQDLRAVLESPRYIHLPTDDMYVVLTDDAPTAKLVDRTITHCAEEVKDWLGRYFGIQPGLNHREAAAQIIASHPQDIETAWNVVLDFHKIFAPTMSQALTQIEGMMGKAMRLSHYYTMGISIQRSNPLSLNHFKLYEEFKANFDKIQPTHVGG